jgi:hypothetical protein
MTREQIETKIDALAKKRDHCCEVLNKPLLGWSYQVEINQLADQLESLANKSNSEPSK